MDTSSRAIANVQVTRARETHAIIDSVRGRRPETRSERPSCPDSLSHFAETSRSISAPWPGRPSFVCCKRRHDRTNRRQHLVGIHRCRIFDDGKSKSPRHSRPCGKIAGLLANHLTNGFGLQDPPTIQFALVEHHLVEPRDISRRREESGTAQRRASTVVDVCAVQYEIAVSRSLASGAIH